MKFIKLLFLPILAFSFEVEFNKKFSHELAHDTLSMFLTVSITDDSEHKVSSRLEIFNQKIKSYDKVERKLGSFNIRPRYKHSNNTPRITGYIGELRYKVNSRKARFMDEFISEVTEMKRNRDTTVSVNNLSWSVREDTYNVTLDLLRLESINWGIQYSKNLSKDLDKDCNLKNIDVNTTNQMIAPSLRAVYTSSSINKRSVPVPESDLQKIIINPRYKLECK